MKKFNFLENLLRREFAMSGMSGMRGMNGLRADAVNPDSQPTVNRQSRLTSVQRHDSVTSARVAREWLNSSTRLRVDFDSLSTRLRVCPLKLVSVLAILLTIGVGNAWGAEEIYKTATFTSTNCTNNSNYTSNIKCTVGDDSWSLVNAANNNGAWDYVKMGAKKSKAADATKVTTCSVNTSAAYSDAVTKVVVYGTLDRGSVSAKLIYASNSSYTTNKVESSALTSFTDGKMTFVIASPTASRYYKVELVCSNTTTTNGVVSLTKVEYYHEVAGCTGTQLGTPVVTATPSSTQIVLSWPAVSNASSYKLSWNGGAWTAAASPVTKTGLTNGTSYTYQVKAIGNGTTYCDGDPSEEASAIPGTYYTVTWYRNNSVYATTSVRSGTQPKFPDTPESCVDDTPSFYGWATAGWTGRTTDISGKTIYTKERKLPVVSGAVSYYAVFTDAEYSYNRVTSNPGAANWEGDYLIAYSSSVFADGRTGGESGIGAKDASVNPSTNLSGDVVAASWGDTYYVTLEKVSADVNTYLLQTQDGLYNYRTANSNGISTSAVRETADDNPLTVTYTSQSDIDITVSSTAFHYNTDGYFRFYKDGGQNSVYLYKKTASGTPNYITSCCTPHDVTLTGSGTVTGGTFEVDPTSACASTTISISAEAATGYTFVSWSIYKTGTPATTVSPVDASAASTTFTMPAYAVTVNATFKALTSYSVTWMVDGTTWNDKGGTSSVYEGYKVSTLPTAPDTGDFCGDKFMGWTTDANYVYNSSPLYTTASGFPVASSDQTFYAVFADFNE